jgi:hypothetical protein
LVLQWFTNVWQDRYGKQIYNLFNLLELLDFWTSAIVRYSKELEHNPFWKLDLFLPSGDGEDTFLAPIERTNLSHWTNCVQSLEFKVML